jgi:predicted nucleotidyltransferase
MLPGIFCMKDGWVQEKFCEALNGLVEQVKEDRSILAAILCGSLSHDTVWSRSDIDLVLVTIDDKKPPAEEDSGIALYADAINVHAFLIPRAEFRKIVEGSLRSSFMHSFLAKGRVLFSHDETVTDLCSKLSEIGERDVQVQLLRASVRALSAIYKARKWFVTRKDLNYSALWILYAATPLAQIEVLSARLLADREVIPQAMTLNPEFFRTIYADLLNSRKTARAVEAALDAVDRYIAARVPSLFGLVIEHLRDVREARSSTEIESYFSRNLNLSGVTAACEYLADEGLIGKASTPLRLTRRSNVQVQELAFFYQAEGPDAC